MAIHSSTIAWKIPWTEEPGRLVYGVTESDVTERLHFTFQVLPSTWARSGLLCACAQPLGWPEVYEYLGASPVSIEHV